MGFSEKVKNFVEVLEKEILLFAKNKKKITQ